MTPSDGVGAYIWWAASSLSYREPLDSCLVKEGCLLLVAILILASDSTVPVIS